MSRLNTPEFYDKYGLVDPADWVEHRKDFITNEMTLRFDLEADLDDELYIIKDAGSYTTHMSDDEAREIMRQWNTDACFEWRLIEARREWRDRNEQKE